MKEILKKQSKLLLVLLLLNLFLIKVYATGSRIHYFKTKQVFARFHVAFGDGFSTEEENKAIGLWMDNFYTNVNLGIKSLFGIDKYAEKAKQKIVIHYSHEKVLTKAELKDELARQAKIDNFSSISQQEFYEGYTLQLATVRDWESYRESEENWWKKLSPFVNKIEGDEGGWEEGIARNEWLGVIYVEEGDESEGMIFPRIWSYGELYKDIEVRFGLFSTKSDALEAARKLKLERSQVQILPVKMSFESFKLVVMDKYYQ